MAIIIPLSHAFLRNSRLKNTRPRSQRNQCSNNVDRERLTVPHCESHYKLVMENIKILKCGEELPPCLLVNKKEEEEKEEKEEEILEKNMGVCTDPDDVAFFAGWGC